jgi:hypothetical protein
MRVWCNCGRTLDPEGRCDASHALTREQYAEMLARRGQIDLRKINSEQRKNQRH